MKCKITVVPPIRAIIYPLSLIFYFPKTKIQDENLQKTKKTTIKTQIQMFFCLNKNFPQFNHKDTILLKSPLKCPPTPIKTTPKDLLLFDKKTRKSSSIYFSTENDKKAILGEKSIVLQKLLSPYSVKGRENSHKTSEISQITELPRLNSHSFIKKSKENTQSLDKTGGDKILKNQGKIISKPFPKKIPGKNKKSFDEKTANFLEYLTSLKSFKNFTPKKQKEEKPKSPKNRRTHAELELHLNAVDLKKFIQTQGKRKDSALLFVDSGSIKKTNMTINSIPSNLNGEYNMINSPMPTATRLRLKKRGSLSMASNSRVFRIRNYNLLSEIVGKLAKNLEIFLAKVSNERKAYKLVSNMLKFNKLKYLEALFFIDGKEQFVENLGASAIENACFTRESQFNVGNNAQIYEEKLISNTITTDLTVVNEKIETYLVERHIHEMKNLTEDLTFKLKRLAKIEVEKFNYETMPDHSLIDDIIDMRNQFGNLDNFDKKELIIGKTIDEMIKNVKYDQQATENYFNVIDIRKK